MQVEATPSRTSFWHACPVLRVRLDERTYYEAGTIHTGMGN